MYGKSSQRVLNSLLHNPYLTRRNIHSSVERLDSACDTMYCGKVIMNQHCQGLLDFPFDIGRYGPTPIAIDTFFHMIQVLAMHSCM
jgi:hypothetical protein